MKSLFLLLSATPFMGLITNEHSQAAPVFSDANWHSLGVQSEGNVILFWPAIWTSFGLEVSPLVSPASWTPSAAQVNDDGINKSVALPVNGGAQFFR